jgi:deoxyribonuclease V
MNIQQKHAWDVTTQEAREIQNELSLQINTQAKVNYNEISVVGGADISFNRKDSLIYATIVFLDFSTLQLLDVFSLSTTANFPYVPGYLSFREIPPLLKLAEQLNDLPDVLLCDGQGIAHPRGLGLASHLGLILDIPTVGCAKSVLVGDYQLPAVEKGARSPLVFQGKQVGVALRTRYNVKPVYVSVGHKIRLEDAVKIVSHCSPRYRIPEPIRYAHRFVNAYRAIENERKISYKSKQLEINAE